MGCERSQVQILSSRPINTGLSWIYESPVLAGWLQFPFSSQNFQYFFTSFQSNSRAGFSICRQVHNCVTDAFPSQKSLEFPVKLAETASVQKRSVFIQHVLRPSVRVNDRGPFYQPRPSAILQRWTTRPSFAHSALFAETRTCSPGRRWSGVVLADRKRLPCHKMLRGSYHRSWGC